jgi:hypothetical protein
MAANKSKRSIHLAQPQPQRPRLNHNSAEHQPVKPHVYRAIADMNAGFEQALQGLQTIQEISFLCVGSLKGLRNLVARLRAQANHELTAILTQREKANAGHFQRLCLEQQNSRTQHIS